MPQHTVAEQRRRSRRLAPTGGDLELRDPTPLPLPVPQITSGAPGQMPAAVPRPRPPIPLPPQAPRFQAPAPLRPTISGPRPMSATRANPEIDQLRALLAQQDLSGDAEDQRLTALIERLGQPLSVAPPNFDRFSEQAAGVRARLTALLTGEGVDVGDIAADPEARAFRIARTREREQQREAAANRLSASGLTGSGEFDTSVAQIGEAAAEDIAGFEAGLAGRRRGDILREQTTAAGLTLQDLERQAGLETGRFGAELAAAQAGRAGQLGAAQALQTSVSGRRAGRQAERGNQLGLLQTLLADQAQAEAAEEREADRAAGAEQAQFGQELAIRGEQRAGEEAAYGRATGSYEQRLRAFLAEQEQARQAEELELRRQREEVERALLEQELEERRATQEEREERTGRRRRAGGLVVPGILSRASAPRPAARI